MTGEGTTGKSLSSDPSHCHWDLRRERNRLGMGGQGWWGGGSGWGSLVRVIPRLWYHNLVLQPNDVGTLFSCLTVPSCVLLSGEPRSGGRG